jgi:penicillin-binding protein 1A
MEPRGGYFKEEVRRQLIEMFGSDAVHEKGLRVYSTIDPAMQRAAEEALEEGIREIETRRAYRHPRRDDGEERATPAGEPDYLQGALIALDPLSGEVRALVGGRDFAASPFNRATQAFRQPGSAFKPILYAAALDHGITPITILEDLDDPVPAAEGAWLPAEGMDDVSALTVRAALQVSSNRAAVSLMRLTGIDRVLDYAARFGLGPQPRVPSVALGSGSVTLEALTAAYAAFANGGTLPRPTFCITRVTDAEGRILFEAAPSGERSRPRAVSPATAFIVGSLLRGVLDFGTGASVRREGFGAPAAGKTGTTDDYKDAWFIGFTPGLAAGVWIGFDHPRTIVPRGYGSHLAAPVWAQFMSEVAGQRDSDEWIEPPPDVVRVEVCISSLAVATEACRRATFDAAGGVRGPHTYVEYFASGTEPVDHCPLHRSRFDSLVALFRSPSRPVRKPSESAPAPPEPAPPSANTSDVLSRSVRVVHDHVFGNCTGRLVAGPDGLRYVTPHKDGFRLRFTELAGVAIDVERQRIRVSDRRGRRYNFRTATAHRDALAALQAALDAK